jgi:Protein of unknown function
VKAGDRAKLIGIPPELPEGNAALQTLATFQKCMGHEFVIAGLNEIGWAEINIESVTGSVGETIWVEPQFLALAHIEKATLSNDELDALLLAHADAHWQKVAMIIGKAMSANKECDSDRMGQRIAALVDAGKLESAGDISNWRFSEIRLPAKRVTI